VILGEPDAVERVLRGNRANYPKGSVYNGARLLLGNGLVTSEGSFWERQRRLAQPAFRNDRLDDYLHTMAKCTAVLLGEWREHDDGSVVDLHGAMTRLTMDIVGRTLFGLDLTRQHSAAGKAFTRALRGIGTRGPDDLQVPLWLPTPGNLRFRKALRELDRLVYDIIRRFRAGEAENASQTLLGAYMASRDPLAGDGMSDRQLRDEVITLYLAGHETTANLLTWTFYALAREPGVAAQVQDEIESRLSATAPRLEELRSLSYMPRVLSEVLRLFPPVWTIARDVVADDIVCGYRVPAGSFVLLSPYITQRLEDYWPDPQRFDPERFAPEASRGRHPFAYFPFSAGPRICIGKHFSLYEAQLVLAMLLREFRIEPVDPRPIGFKSVGTLRPNRNIKVRIRPL
jgi:cytochrome P450